ncbi:hypothetical protein BJ170DRAFT_593447 [Xylariales sp. AK1849]|nr:hypothetical protein BJ170DRAFT_593447 [Xylariales sp. AK1849]
MRAAVEGLRESNAKALRAATAKLEGIRAVTYGLALVALQAQGNEAGITTMVAVFPLAGLIDGIVAWRNGGELRSNVWGHIATFVGLAGWSAWSRIKVGVRVGISRVGRVLRVAAIPSISSIRAHIFRCYVAPRRQAGKDAALNPTAVALRGRVNML